MWLEVENDFLQLMEDDEIVWQVPITDLVLIGEYTTAAGPSAEDYYYVSLEWVVRHISMKCRYGWRVQSFPLCQ
jgi:hypothetical protein